jgi:hypothetical protein
VQAAEERRESLLPTPMIAGGGAARLQCDRTLQLVSALVIMVTAYASRRVKRSPCVDLLILFIARPTESLETVSKRVVQTGPLASHDPTSA